MRFEDIRSEADGAVYPRHLLAGCHDALVLFAAGFLGRQDAFWIAQADVHGTCVDVRPELVARMERLYPFNWEFVVADVYGFDPGRKFDLASIDCPSGHFARCAELLPTWCSFARRYVVLGTGPHVAIRPPDGWRLLERRHRSDYAGGVEWAVLEKA